MSPRSLRNRILASLPDEQRLRIGACADQVQLKGKTLLFDLDQPITSVYFPIEGVVSLVSILSDGSAVESATVGNEGMVGLPVFLGARSMSAQAFVQVPGFGYRLATADFLAELERGPELRIALNRYTQAVITLLAQNSACNRRHSIQARCARWLLLTHDRISGDSFELTQKALSLMLGVRRATVTVAAGLLQQAGLIEYDRGVITVVDRAGLEAAACECYAIVRNEFARLQGDAAIADPLADVTVSRGGITTVDEVDIANGEAADRGNGVMYPTSRSLLSR